MSGSGVALIPAKTGADAAFIADMARRIWTEHYTPIIGSGQVEYMLRRFQSAESIYADFTGGGYEYFVIQMDGKPAGYVAIKREANGLYISKFYVEKDMRRRGIFSSVMETLKDWAKRDGCESIFLNVNKNNAGSVAAYKKAGFEIEEAVVNDIGSGFVMDDYVMRLKI